MSSIVIFGDTSGSITLDTPAVAGTNTITLPANTGTILTTASSINASSITSGSLPKQQLPSGSILQVVQVTKTNSFSTASSTFVDVTDLSLSITPTSASNKVLILAMISLGATAGVFAIFPRFVRNSTTLPLVADLQGDNLIQAYAMYEVGSACTFPIPFNYLDSPATTSATTYKLQVRTNGGNTGWVNRQPGGTNAQWSASASSIIALEVAG